VEPKRGGGWGVLRRAATRWRKQSSTLVEVVGGEAEGVAPGRGSRRKLRSRCDAGEEDADSSRTEAKGSQAPCRCSWQAPSLHLGPVAEERPEVEMMQSCLERSAVPGSC
jgi:hypothetical protein